MKIVKRAIGNTKAYFHKNGPTIEVLLGIGLFGVAVGLAVKATKKEEIHEATADLLDELDSIHKAKEDATKGKIEYPVAEAAQDTIKAYSKAGVKLAKIYIPTVIAFSAGTALVLHSHKEMQLRYAAMASAYSAVNNAFREYRDRVVKKYGEEVDKKLRFGVDEKDICYDAKTEKLDPNGPVSKNPYNLSDFARYFGQESYDGVHFNPMYQGDHDLDMVFLRTTRETFQIKLDTKGYVLLADVYEALGYIPTKASYEVGWVANNPKKELTIIDFGITHCGDIPGQEYIKGWNDAIYLDFNVDYIMDKLPIRSI